MTWNKRVGTLRVFGTLGAATAVAAATLGMAGGTAAATPTHSATPTAPLSQLLLTTKDFPQGTTVTTVDYTKFPDAQPHSNATFTPAKCALKAPVKADGAHTASANVHEGSTVYTLTVSNKNTSIADRIDYFTHCNPLTATSGEGAEKTVATHTFTPIAVPKDITHAYAVADATKVTTGSSKPEPFAEQYVAFAHVRGLLVSVSQNNENEKLDKTELFAVLRKAIAKVNRSK